MDPLLTDRQHLLAARSMLVFHAYLSVPVVSHALHNLYNWIRAYLDQPISKWIVMLDAHESETLIIDCYTLPNCDLHAVSDQSYAACVCEKVDYYVEQCSVPGTIVLIAKDGDFSPVWKHRINGWKIFVVHPPGLSWGLQQMAQHCLELPVTLGPPGDGEANTVLLGTHHLSHSLPMVSTRPWTPPWQSSGSLVWSDAGSTGFYALTPPLSLPTASGDAVLSSFKDFIQHRLPTGIAERNLAGIIQEMQVCSRRRYNGYSETTTESYIVLGQPIRQREPPEDVEERAKFLADLCTSVVLNTPPHAVESVLKKTGQKPKDVSRKKTVKFVSPLGKKNPRGRSNYHQRDENSGHPTGQVA